jgi:hypothetical protein
LRSSFTELVEKLQIPLEEGLRGGRARLLFVLGLHGVGWPVRSSFTDLVEELPGPPGGGSSGEGMLGLGFVLVWVGLASDEQLTDLVEKLQIPCRGFRERVC